jgi:myo-inositol 2-dehydrogenase/D-chiro-inositol 1-dehydrogenase
MRYGIVGCGMMGQEHIRNIALLAQAEVSAFVEPDAGMAAATQALVPGATPCPDLDGLLARNDVDALVIASPNHCHVPQLQDVARIRPLPVLVEKPIATRPEDDAALRDLARAYPAPIWVAMEYRYMPPIARFRELAEEATGGIKMLTIREHRFPFLEKVGDWNRFNRNTGGTLVEKCCHFFDLMRLILQDEPVRVMASAGQAVNHLDETLRRRDPGHLGPRLCHRRFRGRRARDAGAVHVRRRLRLPGGDRGRRPHRQDPGLRARPHAVLELRYRAAARAHLIVSPRHPTGPHRVDIPVDPQLLEAGDHNGATYYQHRRFLDAVRTGRTPEVTLEDGAMAVRMGLAAQEAALTGKAVSL